MEGLSARSVIINAFCQLVILLYLFDNETSYVVLFSSVLVSLSDIQSVIHQRQHKGLPYICGVHLLQAHCLPM
jgi:hypothetical protein